MEAKWNIFAYSSWNSGGRRIVEKERANESLKIKVGGVGVGPGKRLHL